MVTLNFFAVRTHILLYQGEYGNAGRAKQPTVPQYARRNEDSFTVRTA